jgi:chaperonin GroES
MHKKKQIETKSLEIVEPIGKRVLIRKDQDKKQTKGGIQLSAEVENSPDIPLRQYDKVLFNPKGAIPVDFEGDNRLFVVEVENVVAVFRKS